MCHYYYYYYYYILLGKVSCFMESYTSSAWSCFCILRQHIAAVLQSITVHKNYQFWFSQPDHIKHISVCGVEMSFPCNIRHKSYVKVCKLHVKIQGGSNMTGTNCDLFTHKSSRSYLNHLVIIIWIVPCIPK
jgi:hypothetical protein